MIRSLRGDAGPWVPFLVGESFQSAHTSFYLFIYLFLAVLGLHSCVQAFSSWSEGRLLSSCGAWASHCGDFSCCRVWGLDGVGVTVAVHRLSCSAA